MKGISIRIVEIGICDTPIRPSMHIQPHTLKWMNQINTEWKGNLLSLLFSAVILYYLGDQIFDQISWNKIKLLISNVAHKSTVCCFVTIVICIGKMHRHLILFDILHRSVVPPIRQLLRLDKESTSFIDAHKVFRLSSSSIYFLCLFLFKLRYAVTRGQIDLFYIGLIAHNWQYNTMFNWNLLSKICLHTKSVTSKNILNYPFRLPF